MPRPLWQARHYVSLDGWTSKVTALVEAYGPFPERTVIIVCIRYSRGRELGKEQYDSCVQRCVDAASTLIGHIRSQPGQADRQFLIYPWIRAAISSTDDWYKPRFHPTGYSSGIPRTTNSSCRLKELEFVLNNVQPNTEVWWLSIGIDALTTDIANLRRARSRWPAPDFTLAVMVHKNFLPNTAAFGTLDICPPRPAASGMRIRIYSFASLLPGAHDLGDSPAARTLLAVWQYMNDAKLDKTSYDRNLTLNRNIMPVSPARPDNVPALAFDRM
ncbi:hypothetical protein FJTKL_05933 [Diaporthe vaccinii]|uniref:Uncharacterized protein n=1 Tax=Diaporthe vaccinii TaxID=105482 RepID=A0ABR4DRA8_9PEZI